MAIRKNNSSTVLKEDGFALIQSYIDRIDKAHTLDEVFNLHKLLWNDGIRHSGFGPDRRGMFRCQDISTMSKDEVYLGNVFGIWTNTLSFFEKGRNRQCIRDNDVWKGALCKRFWSQSIPECSGFS